MFIDRFIDKYFGWNRVYSSLEKKGVNKCKFAQYQSHGVDIDLFKPVDKNVKNKIRKKHNINETSLVLAWFGRLEERKSAKNALLLCKKLINDRKLENIYLLVVGGGIIDYYGKEDKSYVNELKSLAHDYGINNRVVFTGWIPHYDIPTYMGTIDIACLLENDPQGGSFLRECMSCGRVALSVDGNSGVQREFMNENHSILVSRENYYDESCDVIERLLNNREELDELGRNARKYSLQNLTFLGQAKSIIGHFD
jgi:glycosyltransferase involved in cell wall biosynthesis